MARFEDDRVDKGRNILLRYIKWMFRGKYIRFVKILYTSLLVTALITFKFNAFLSMAFVGFLGREVLFLLIKDDYEEDSYLMKLANISN